MLSDSLISAIPDLAAFVRRDGVITHHLGGKAMPFILPGVTLAGAHLDDALQSSVANLASRLVRRALDTRSTCDALFDSDTQQYEIRVSPQGVDRALCVVRHSTAEKVSTAVATEQRVSGNAERRGFGRRFRDSVANALLQEEPLALALIHLDGLHDIGRLIDFRIADQVVTTALTRLRGEIPPLRHLDWFAGMLGDELLAIVLRGTTEQGLIRELSQAVCKSLAAPVTVSDAEFHLRPSTGIAILGQDAARAPELIEHARVAMFEARRGSGGGLQFYSADIGLLPAARLDIERELRRAIGDGQIALRYVSRCDLQSGHTVALQAYMRWVHPLRGEIAPAEFIPIADATGLSVALSRAALERLAADAPLLRQRFGTALHLSFGALRQHIVGGQLARDSSRWESMVGSGHLEFRISERALSGLPRPGRLCRDITAAGGAVVIDEVGRGFSSIARLARLPIAALQMDRAQVVAAAGSEVALRTCRAIAALAHGLEVSALAAGIDDAAARVRLLACGYTQGFGDLYPPLDTSIM